MRSGYRLGAWALVLGVGCQGDTTFPEESWYPRELAVEVDASGTHFLHVAGFADGSLRIFRVDDADLTLTRAFWAGFGADPTAQSSGAALIEDASFAGAWGVALTSSGDRLLVSGRLAHDVVRLDKAAGLWEVAGTLENDTRVPLEVPLEGGGTELLGINRVRGLDKPLGIALSPSETALYVAGSGDNAIARLRIVGPDIGYQGATTEIPNPRALLALPVTVSSTTSSTAVTGTSTASRPGPIDDIVYALSSFDGTCNADDSSLLSLRWQDDEQRLLQVVRSADALATCEGEADPELCLRDDLATPGVKGAFDLAHTITSSGAEYVLVTSPCTGTVTAFLRGQGSLLDYAGAYRVVAPWEDAAAVTTSSVSTAGLRNLVVHNDVVYATATDGGFVAHFPLSCVTTTSTSADTSACATILCLDEAMGCATDPATLTDARASTAHPWGLAASGSVLYVGLDLEGQIAVLDLADDGTPTLRYTATPQ